MKTNYAMKCDLPVTIETRSIVLQRSVSGDFMCISFNEIASFFQSEKVNSILFM